MHRSTSRHWIAALVIVVSACAESPTHQPPPVLGSIASSPCPYNALAAPLDEVQVTDGFSSKHKGLDLRAPTPLPVNASRAGVVETIGFDERPLPTPDLRSRKMVKGWGVYVKLRHADGTRTLYGHLTKGSTRHLAKGQTVAAGEQIALSGNTGGSSAPHLHIEYRDTNDIPFDPAPCLAAGIEIDPTSKNLEIGQAASFTVRVVTVAGSTLSGQAEPVWSSSNPQVATVDASGVVRATAAGTTQIRAVLGRMEGTASVTVTLPSPMLHTELSSFQSAANVMSTLTFDGIQNGVPSTTPGGYPGVVYYSSASYGVVTIHATNANSNKPGFTTISHWAVHKASYEFYQSGAHFGDALIPSLGAYRNDDGILFTFAESPAEAVTAVGAYFGSIQEVSPCCVQQWVTVTFRNGESLGISLNEIRGGERPSDAFFGITSPGRPIKSIEFNQLGHTPLLDNFMYGQAL